MLFGIKCKIKSVARTRGNMVTANPGITAITGTRTTIPITEPIQATVTTGAQVIINNEIISMLQRMPIIKCRTES